MFLDFLLPIYQVCTEQATGPGWSGIAQRPSRS